MSKTTVAYFIPHCDHEDCCMGVFSYECPNCEKDGSSTKIWWEQESIQEGQQHEFKCKKCKTDLIVEYNNEEFEFIVKEK